MKLHKKNQNLKSVFFNFFFISIFPLKKTQNLKMRFQKKKSRPDFYFNNIKKIQIGTYKAYFFDSIDNDYNKLINIIELMPLDFDLNI